MSQRSLPACWPNNDYDDDGVDGRCRAGETKVETQICLRKSAESGRAYANDQTLSWLLVCNHQVTCTNQVAVVGAVVSGKRELSVSQEERCPAMRLAGEERDNASGLEQQQ